MKTVIAVAIARLQTEMTVFADREEGLLSSP
jgi:hypothetical protein